MSTLAINQLSNQEINQSNLLSKLALGNNEGNVSTSKIANNLNYSFQYLQGTQIVQRSFPQTKEGGKAFSSLYWELKKTQPNIQFSFNDFKNASKEFITGFYENSARLASSGQAPGFITEATTGGPNRFVKFLQWISSGLKNPNFANLNRQKINIPSLPNWATRQGIDKQGLGHYFETSLNALHGSNIPPDIKMRIQSMIKEGAFTAQEIDKIMYFSEYNAIKVHLTSGISVLF
jgi:hypothetical protein